MSRWRIAVVCAFFFFGAEAARAAELLPLRVMYVGSTKGPRAGNFEIFLKQNFRGVQTADRESIVSNGDRDMKIYLPFYLAKDVCEELTGKNRAEVGQWYQRVHRYLRAGEDGKLMVDADLETMGVAANTPQFFDKMFAHIDDAARSATARKLLHSYVPDGPDMDAPAEQWRLWWKVNRSYLFFTDAGGYRWLVDPLAKRRGVATEQLRGPARATLPALKTGK